MTKGTLVLVPFPFTDLSGQKIRPALVLHNNSHGEDCILAFISSVKPKKPGKYHVHVKSSPQNGLKTDSTVKVGKIATLQKKIILGELGMLESQYINVLDTKLKGFFGI